jgi:flagellar hook-associated protein 3 FlgL
MTIGSTTAGSDWFLNGLSNLQQQEAQTQRQLTSGYKVQDAADSPAQAAELVSLGSSLAAAKSYQSNLVRVNAEATGADQALSSGISLIEQARTLALQAANTATSAPGLQSIDAALQGIQQQLVSIANTTVEGRYIFGGNQDQAPPYKADPITGPSRLTTATSVRVITDPLGQPIYQSLTAQQIFDPADAAGAPTGNNAFVALQSLRTAVQAKDRNGIAAALSSLESASGWLNQQQGYYGATEQRLASEQNNTANQITALEIGIGNIRDTDIAQAATDLTRESTAQSAAMAAQAEIPRKSLFDYLG